MAVCGKSPSSEAQGFAQSRMDVLGHAVEAEILGVAAVDGAAVSILRSEKGLAVDEIGVPVSGGQGVLPSPADYGAPTLVALLKRASSP
jgi:hypothetical protein